MKRLALISRFLFAGLAFCAVSVVAAAPAPNSGTASTAGKRTVPRKRRVKTAASRKASLRTVSTPTSRKRRYRRHYRYRRYRYRGPLHPSQERITEIQSALARNGYYEGDPNGKWDSTTIAAMRNFQEDHGLDGTGKIDALTLQKLGLGSEIAGVDAPRAPVPGQSSLTPAPPQAGAAPAVADPAKPKLQTPHTPQTQTPKSPDSTGSGTFSAPATSTASPATSTPSPAPARSSTLSSPASSTAPLVPAGSTASSTSKPDSQVQ
jgi:peptidoglycan hydrolase-like protein with peptidoglycan-binding domain